MDTTIVESEWDLSSGVQRRAGCVRLAALCGIRAGRILYLNQRESTLGRSLNVDFCIPGHDISRRHARVILDVDGIAKIVDLKSTNGCFVNRRRVDVEVMREGDRLRLGKTSTFDIRYIYSFPNPTQDAQWAELIQNGPNLPTLSGPVSSRNQQDFLDLQRLLAFRNHNLGADHPATASALHSMGELYRCNRQFDDALECYMQALHIYEDQSESCPEIAHTLVRIGQCRLEQSQARLAIRPLQRGVEHLVERQASATELATGCFVLAQTMMTLGDTPEIAMEYAEQARLGFAEGDEIARRQVVVVEEWLRSKSFVQQRRIAANRRTTQR